MVEVDIIKLEIFRNLLSSVAEEMGTVLQRSGYSPNIKERRDFSCALFDSKGDIAAQAAHLPVHLGSTPESVKKIIETVDMAPGDCVILNDPYMGGTHLPDITFVEPIFTHEIPTPAFYVANRAHHCDVGGKTLGSMGLCTRIEDEGIIIPPTKLLCGGKLNHTFMKKIMSSVRNPDERKGDFMAQLAANAVGKKRLLNLVKKYSLDEVLFYMNALQDHSERMVRELIKGIPNGIYFGIDHMDDDGMGKKKIPIVLSVSVDEDEITMDFTGSSPQVAGNINAVHAVTRSAAFYVLRCLVKMDIPANSGIFRPINLILPGKSIVNASYPAAVAGGNVETSQRITDVIFWALSKALPGRIPSASQGTMNNVTIGGIDQRTGSEFTYYETIGGGTGA
ncbi:MAG: hydantoinase B/oxoprolinase family protein, partial [Candidatus Thermoplasmatota archaeon]|nr:hydantoinase B/oxoprolinase family protein [Candidatus Thermoplasmatota archaeon]